MICSFYNSILYMKFNQKRTINDKMINDKIIVFEFFNWTMLSRLEQKQ
jgi:hypothetical protein